MNTISLCAQFGWVVQSSVRLAVNNYIGDVEKICHRQQRGVGTNMS